MKPYAPAAFTSQEIYLVFISVTGRDDATAIEKLGGLSPRKISMTQPGIKSPTFWFVT
jgi:hypothetical protein